jgi:hypothetical protein
MELHTFDPSKCCRFWPSNDPNSDSSGACLIGFFDSGIVSEIASHCDSEMVVFLAVFPGEKARFRQRFGAAGKRWLSAVRDSLPRQHLELKVPPIHDGRRQRIDFNLMENRESHASSNSEFLTSDVDRLRAERGGW